LGDILGDIMEYFRVIFFIILVTYDRAVRLGWTRGKMLAEYLPYAASQFILHGPLTDLFTITECDKKFNTND